MKKFVLMVMVAVATMTAGAQFYVGGEVGLWREWQNGANKSFATILPEVGYVLDDSWAIGTVIGYKYQYDKGAKCNALEVAPYARYTFLKLDKVNVFVDGGFGFYTYKWKYKGFKGEAQNAWEVGLKPGVAVNLNDKLSFVTHFGFLGYRDADEAPIFGRNGFGLDASGNALTFGLYWNF